MTQSRALSSKRCRPISSSGHTHMFYLGCSIQGDKLGGTALKSQTWPGPPQKVLGMLIRTCEQFASEIEAIKARRLLGSSAYLLWLPSRPSGSFLVLFAAGLWAEEAGWHFPSHPPAGVFDSINGRPFAMLKVLKVGSFSRCVHLARGL